jgi:hypothetical protein
MRFLGRKWQIKNGSGSKGNRIRRFRLPDSGLRCGGSARLGAVLPLAPGNACGRLSDVGLAEIPVAALERGPVADFGAEDFLSG